MCFFSTRRFTHFIVGEDFFDKYINEGYFSVSELLKDTNFPSEMTGYGTLFNKVMVLNLCENYLEPVNKLSCRSNQLLNAGLQTTLIYILENTKKHISTLKNTESTKRIKISKSILNSDEFKSLCKRENPKKLRTLFLFFLKFRKNRKIFNGSFSLHFVNFS